MSCSNDVNEIRLGQPVGRERADHLEQPVSARRPRRGDEGRVDQATEQQGNRFGNDLVADRFGRAEVELAVEHAQRRQQGAGGLAQQIDGPCHDVAQRGVAALITINSSERSEDRTEPVVQRRHAKNRGATCSQLQRQWHPVEAATQRGDVRITGIQVVLGPGPQHTIDEELRGVGPITGGRERFQQQHGLIWQLESDTAGRDDAHPGT